MMPKFIGSSNWRMMTILCNYSPAFFYLISDLENVQIKIADEHFACQRRSEHYRQHAVVHYPLEAQRFIGLE